MMVQRLLVFVVLLFGLAVAQTVETVSVESNGQTYPAYLATPDTEGSYPGIVLLHSFRGLSDGYKTFTEEFAAEGFVVMAVEWQTFAQQPEDAVIEQLVRDAAALLGTRADTNEQLGLTGFCAGGRYTMLLLPQIKDFAAGFAWYGFPKNGDPAAIDLVAELDAPLYITHGSADQPSPIADIYEYAQALDNADKYFELKVYQGEPHGFMVDGAQVVRSEAATDAFSEMVGFFNRQLKDQ